MRMEFRKLFYILVHPNAHACFPNTKINTTRKYTNTKYIGLEIIQKCYQILGPIGKNIMHISTGCPWNHFGCQSLKERFLETPCRQVREMILGKLPKYIFLNKDEIFLNKDKIFLNKENIRKHKAIKQKQQQHMKHMENRQH